MCCILFFLSCISQALFIQALHPASSFMYQPGFIHSCAASPLFFHVSAKLHSFMHFTLPLLAYISHEAWSLLDLYFCLTYIKAGTQLYVQEIQADGYKIPCWPIQSLFSLVHIAWMHIFISLHFLQLWARRSLSKSDLTVRIYRRIPLIHLPFLSWKELLSIILTNLPPPLPHTYPRWLSALRRLQALLRSQNSRGRPTTKNGVMPFKVFVKWTGYGGICWVKFQNPKIPPLLKKKKK